VYDIVQRVGLGEQPVQDDRHRCRWHGSGNGVSSCSPGRPAQRPNTLRKACTALMEAGSHAAGCPADSWRGTLLRNRLHRRLGVAYPPHAHCPCLPTLAWASQHTRFVSAPCDAAAPRRAWRSHTRPQVLRTTRLRIVLLWLGDEASVALWDSLGSPGSPQSRLGADAKRIRSWGSSTRW
jgi:hypothetical protein